MLLSDWFSQEADCYRYNEDDDKEDNSKMKIVDISNDGRSEVFIFMSTRDALVGTLPHEPSHTHSQANHQTPEGALKTRINSLMES